MAHKSVAKQVAQARQSALDLRNLLGVSNDALSKLVEARNGNGKPRRRLKLKK